MSTLLSFINNTRKRGLFWWIKFYWNEFLNSVYENKMSNKINNSWKGVKIAKTITPEGWTKDNAFKYLNEQYKGKVWKRQ